jgi:hypothetical protein
MYDKAGHQAKVLFGPGTPDDGILEILKHDIRNELWYFKLF